MQVESGGLTTGMVRLNLLERLEALEERIPQPGAPQKPLLPDWVMEAALEQGIKLPVTAQSLESAPHTRAAKRRQCRRGR
jgi:hypothetical protein